jgi:hypothetical protein
MKSLRSLPGYAEMYNVNASDGVFQVSHDFQLLKLWLS